jgi:hypothetical protein
MKEDKRERMVNLAAYQGNRFIKELLQEKSLPIGATEKEFRANMREALDSGKLAEEEIEEWLDRVEGWGDQHAYVYIVPLSARELTQFRDLSRVEQLLKKVGKSRLLNRSDAALLPDSRELTLIQHTQLGIRWVWHESLPWKQRLKEKDFEEYDDELEVDVHYEAHMHKWGRGVTSFAWRFDLGLAAAFIPRRESADYETQRDLTIQTVKEVIHSVSLWPLLSISSAIFALDEKASKEHPKDPSKRVLRSRATDFRTQGGSVVLTSTREDLALQDNIPLQTVRKAVSRKLGFTGGKGDFYIRTGRAEEELHAVLYGPQNRVAFPRQMSEETVWSFIKQLSDFTTKARP